MKKPPKKHKEPPELIALNRALKVAEARRLKAHKRAELGYARRWRRRQHRYESEVAAARLAYEIAIRGTPPCTTA